MKLLYLAQYFSFPTESNGTRAYDLASQFVKNGIDVVIVTSSSNKELFTQGTKWVYQEKEGLKLWIVYCPYNQKMSFYKRIISFMKFMSYASVKVNQIKVDLVLATSTPLTIAVPALIKKGISQTPFIFEARDVWPEVPIKLGYISNPLLKKLLYWFEKLVYKKAFYIVALSSGMKENITQRVNVKNIEVIPNISEINRFKNLSTKTDINYLEDKKIVLHAGTMGPVNNILYVAKLAEKLININPQIVFLIIGNGNEKETIINYCRSVDILNKNIFFLNPVSKNALPYLYSKITVGSSFMLDNPIIWDNSANKFFDTLAAGRPILINYLGWQADVIKKEKCGYVLSPNPTDDEINEFSNYVMNDKIIEEHGINARLAAEQYSLESATKKYLKIIRSLENV